MPRELLSWTIPHLGAPRLFDNVLGVWIGGDGEGGRGVKMYVKYSPIYRFV